MEITRDGTDRDLMRLAVRLGELEAWRDRESLAISEIRFRSREVPDWQTVRLGDRWPRKDRPVFLRFEGTLPEGWAGCPVHGRFDVGGEGLLAVNGRPVGGLNRFHEEHPLVADAVASTTLVVEVEAVAHDLFGAPNPEPYLREARLLVPDFGVRRLHDDLSAALAAAVHLKGCGRAEVAERIGNVIQKALASLRLPRAPSDAYLARLAGATSNHSPGNIQDTESLAAIWEEWKFGAAPAQLSEEVRAALENVRQQFAAELASIAASHPPEGRVWLTGHAHIDLAWLWPLEETHRKIRRTFCTVLSLMERYPDLHFNQSSAQVYAWVEQDDPALFERIRQRVGEGRWEIIGGMWVEPDGNLLAGESWVRQILTGQRYFQGRFGRRPTVAWLPDSFGFTGNLPQLLLSGGLRFFFTQKLTWNEVNPFPYDLYHWEGIDGSRVLAHSFQNPPRGYNADVDAPDVGSTWRNFRGKRFHHTTLLAVGHGDGGGGPTGEMLERAKRLANFPAMPRLKTGTVSDFYGEIRTRDLPVWVGEQYLEYHRGTYTSQAAVKALHRRLENGMVEAETAATLAFVLAKQPYPQEKLHRIWETLLLNEFHDILPGSGIHSVNATAREQLRTALEAAQTLRRHSLAGAPGDRFPAAGVVLWNLGLAPRTVRAEIPDVAEGRLRLQTADGRSLATQTTAAGLLIDGGTTIDGLSPLSIRFQLGEPAPVTTTLQATPRRLENEYLRIEIAEGGGLASVYDKEFGREILAGVGNQLWIYTDVPRRFDAWDVDESYLDEGVELHAGAAPELVEAGPLRATVRVGRGVGDSEIVQLYQLHRGSRRLDFVTDVRWRGRRGFLRALFPLNVRTHEMWAETAFGAVARPTHQNTSWDQAKFEVPAHRWVDLSEPNYGVSLLSDSKYGYNARGNVLGVSLLRSPIYPDPYADEGDHRFTYALYPHPGDWRTGGTLAAAQELQAPLTVLTNAGWTDSGAPLVALAHPTLVLAALKKAEDSDDVIVRLYEPYGNRGETALRTALPLRSARLVNILEEETGEIPVDQETSLCLSFTPFQVISLKLTFA